MISIKSVKALSLVFALLIASCERAQLMEKSPFLGVPASQELRKIPDAEKKGPEYKRFHLSVFENLGDWAPHYMIGTNRVLRNEGRALDADATLLFSRLRRETIRSLCDAESRVSELEEWNERSLRWFVSEVRDGRDIDFLNEAVSYALELDERHEWNFKPGAGWCDTGFKVIDDTAVLKQPLRFALIHDQNRKALARAATRVSRAATIGVDRNQTPFAFGVGNGANESKFFQIYDPTTPIGPSPTETAYLRAAKLSGTGDEVIFVSTIRSTKHVAYKVTSNYDELLQIPDGYDLAPTHSRTVFIAQETEQCAASFDGCKNAELRIALADRLVRPIKSQNVSIAWDVSGIQQTSGYVRQITDDLRYALVSFSGRPAAGEHKNSNPLTTIRVSLLFVVDLDTGEIVRELKRVEGYAPILSKGRSDGPVSAAIFSDEEGDTFLLTGRPEGDDRVVKRILIENMNTGESSFKTISKPLNVYSLHDGFFFWVLKSHDPSSAIKECGRCDVVGLLPNGEHWVLTRGERAPQTIVLSDTQSGRSIAEITPYRAKTSSRLFSARTGRLVVRLGSETQVYDLAQELEPDR